LAVAQGIGRNVGGVSNELIPPAEYDLKKASMHDHFAAAITTAPSSLPRLVCAGIICKTGMFHLTPFYCNAIGLAVYLIQDAGMIIIPQRLLSVPDTRHVSGPYTMIRLFK
jgi:hypothetical protein